jgi:hypothetical protein
MGGLKMQANAKFHVNGMDRLGNVARDIIVSANMKAVDPMIGAQIRAEMLARQAYEMTSISHIEFKEFC